MKQLLAGCTFIIVVGVVGFLYRYEIENAPMRAIANGSPSLVGATHAGAACTQDAKVCPDGSAVGRTGPNCSFAVCPPPNIEFTYASTTIGFVLPAGYTQSLTTSSSNDSSHLASYVQSAGSSLSTIDIYNYAISAGKTASQIMLAHSTFDASGEQATSTKEFQIITEGNNTFYEILLGDVKNTVHSSYYVYEPNNILRFDINEEDSQGSSTTSIHPNTLPEHEALQQMLATLQVSST